MFLIIDGNNVAWAGFYALERAMKPDTPERRHRVALLGIASMTLGATARAGEPPGAPRGAVLTRVAICFDDGRPLRRREIFPAYQTGREADPKFVQNEPTILAAIDEFTRVAVETLPIEVLRGVNMEADDLIAALVATNRESEKRIVSTDRDFLQLVGPSTTVYSPVKKLVVDESNFVEVAAPKMSSGEPAAFPRERFLDYRAAVGDTSDDLPGIPGIGPLSAAKLLSAGPLDGYFGDGAAVRAALGRRSDAVEQSFADGSARDIVERNRALMDLRRPSPCWSELGRLTSRGRWDRDAFDAWFREQRIAAVDGARLFEGLEALAANRS